MDNKVPVNFLETYTLYEKYKLDFPSRKHLTPIGIERLRSAIYDYTGFDFNYTSLVREIGVDAVIPNMTCIDRYGDPQNMGGSLLTRLERYLRFKYEYSISKESKEKIGNLLADYWLGGENETMYIDICDKIDWRSGEFGEKPERYGGSCWWHGSAIDLFNIHMKNKKAWGIRLFIETKGRFKGIGRVWAIKTSSGYPIIFNAYGWSLMRWSVRLSEFFKVPCVEVPLKLIPDTLFVNNQIGFFLGDKDKKKESYTFNFRKYFDRTSADFYEDSANTLSSLFNDIMSTFPPDDEA